MQQVEPYRLPTLPQILLELQHELQKRDRSYSSVSNIIRKDPALLARVAAVANAGDFNSIEIPGSLTSLCANLGYDALQGIAFSSSAYQAFRSYQNDQISYLEHYWCRSIFGAHIAQSLAKITSYRDPEEAYLCALARGIGQLVMEVQSNGLISKQASNDSSVANGLIYEVEQFGINHNLLSAHLMDDWGFNSSFSDAVKYQAKAVDSIRDAHHLVKIVNLANHAIDDGINGAELFMQNTSRLFAIDAAISQAILVKSRKFAADEANKYGIDWRGSIPLDSTSGTTLQAAEPDLDNSQCFREKHQQLREKVKDISLVSSICRFDVSKQTESQLLSTVKSALQSLLNIGSSMFFLYGKHSDTLKIATREETPAFFKEISIPVERGRSLLTDALLDDKPIRFFPGDPMALEELAVVDRQFLNFLDTEGFYCYPLCFDQKKLGVLLVGIDQWHIESILENKALIQTLIAELGDTLRGFYWEHEQRQDIAENQTKIYEVSVKKAIHEASNPLSVIQNYLEILSQKLDDKPSAKENVALVKSEITRVCEILGQLGRQSVTDELESTWFDLNQLIADQVKIFDTSTVSSGQIETKLDLDDEIPLVWGSANSLKQILTNLILNSIEAMPTGGVISIATADQFYLNENCYVEISIRDTGTGIDTELMPRLFEVKRSLKGKKHAGVGLNIVQTLISDMDGLITCRNSRNGVTWQILLPRKLEH